MQWKRITAVAATVMLAAVACGSPSSNSGTGNGSNDAGTARRRRRSTPRQGPGAGVPGAGRAARSPSCRDARRTPSTRPTSTTSTLTRSASCCPDADPVPLDDPDGKPVLVPDLTDLGTVSADKLTWTFKLQPGIKYEDGTRSRSRTWRTRSSGRSPTTSTRRPDVPDPVLQGRRQVQGPVPGGDTYAGVETPGADTLIIHLAKPFSDLPFYLAFPMFTPIPKAKDTKQDYKNQPAGDRPVHVRHVHPRHRAQAEKNPNWDANTDPVRHQYPDGWDFKWGGDNVKIQRQVLNSDGPDANAINYGNLDATLLPEVKDQAQLVQGDSPCTDRLPDGHPQDPAGGPQGDRQGVPVRPDRKVAGLNHDIAEPASTFLPPSVPGYQKYELAGPERHRQGRRRPGRRRRRCCEAAARSTSSSAGTTTTRSDPAAGHPGPHAGAEKAGFKVKAIGVPTAELRTKVGDYNAPVNMGQAPAGWCSDWPSGTCWFPVLFQTDASPTGNSWGSWRTRRWTRRSTRSPTLTRTRS